VIGISIVILTQVRTKEQERNPKMIIDVRARWSAIIHVSLLRINSLPFGFPLNMKSFGDYQIWFG